MALQELRGQERDRGLDLPPLRLVIAMARAKSQNPALFEDDLPPAPTELVKQAIDTWNEIATEETGWPKVVLTRCTQTRLRRIKNAVKDCGGLVAWRSMLTECKGSSFLTGRTKAEFFLTIDWATKPENLSKILDGNYKNRAAAEVRSLSTQMQPQDEWGRFLRDYKLKGSWPTSLGARPEDPRCRAPAEMLRACRERLGIVVEAPPVLTREQRLESMIVTYRKNEYWDRANQLEEELARLQGRPPVLVPAPDARNPDVVPSREVAGKFWNPPPRADAVSRRMAARERAQDIPVEYDGIPEGSNYEEQD